MKLLYIDLFCGAGGTSTGVEQATQDGQKIAQVIACVNHDANAITSHAANHPQALHFTEDIRTLEISPLIAHTSRQRKLYPEARLVLWASLECTNFSKAKGGQLRDADSRTLAEHLFRYIDALKPDYIQIENVEEFMSWGEVDENGKPISMDAGKSYQRWVNNVCSRGYHFEHRILNSADYGAYTSRKRFFGMFALTGLPIAWPVPTYSKDNDQLFGTHKWRPVREVLDFSDDGKSIFGRPKPLVEATLKRIYAGLIKFVAEGKDKFLVKYNSTSQKGKYIPPSLDNPCPTVTCQNRLGMAFIDMAYGNGTPTDINLPCTTVTTNPKPQLVIPFLCTYNFKGSSNDINKPSPTLLTHDRLSLISPIIQTEEGLFISIYPDDSAIMKKIKQFMALYGIIDIKMRMLRVDELKKIQGFPEQYKLVGTQSEQKKYIGNAVEVHMARALCEALCKALPRADYIYHILTPNRIAK